MVDLPGGGTPAIPVGVPSWMYSKSGPPTLLPAGQAVGDVTQVTDPVELTHSNALGPNPPGAAGEA